MASRVGEQIEAQIQRIERWRKADSSADDDVHWSTIGVGRGLLAGLWRLGVLLAGGLAILIDIIFSAIGPVSEALDGLLGWTLVLLAGPIEILLTVPYVGRVVGGVWRLAISIVWGALNLVEFPMVLLGVMPDKRLRVWICVPHWEQDSLEEARWLKAIELAGQILRREANVRLVPVTPFQTRFGLSDDDE
ncbi:MAG: hypothetical protein ACLFWD_13070, partial [Anaerolineales bacterium]